MLEESSLPKLQRDYSSISIRDWAGLVQIMIVYTLVKKVVPHIDTSNYPYGGILTLFYMNESSRFNNLRKCPNDQLLAGKGRCQMKMTKVSKYVTKQFESKRNSRLVISPNSLSLSHTWLLWLQILPRSRLRQPKNDLNSLCGNGVCCHFIDEMIRRTNPKTTGPD